MVAEVPTFSTRAELPHDKAGHLSSHWLLLPLACWTSHSTPIETSFRKFGLVTGDLSNELFGDELLTCPKAACLEVGTPKALVAHHAVINGRQKNIEAWANQVCNMVEYGFINTKCNNYMSLYWVHPHSGNLAFQSTLKYGGEPETHWRRVRLGDKFAGYCGNKAIALATEKDNSQILSDWNPTETVEVAYQGAVIWGTQPPLRNAETKLFRQNWTKFYRETELFELNRADAIHRTFTQKGFDTAPLPSKTWGAIATYYYNNRDAHVREEWHTATRIYVNWWDVDTRMIPLPYGLKGRWHDELKHLVSDWAGGVRLENTALYGIRIYQAGAWLHPHVDRTSTHALSMIINIAQPEMKEPWPLEILDLKGSRHEVNVDPGSIVFYESAKCMHGRPKALSSPYFVNLFAHYRPMGKPNWYQEHGNYSAKAGDWADNHRKRHEKELEELARRKADDPLDESEVPKGLQIEHAPQVLGEEVRRWKVPLARDEEADEEAPPLVAKERPSRRASEVGKASGAAPPRIAKLFPVLLLGALVYVFRSKIVLYLRLATRKRGKDANPN